MSLVFTYVSKNGDIHMLSDSCWTISDTGIYSTEEDINKSFVVNYKEKTKKGLIEKKAMIAFTGSATIFQYLKYQFDLGVKSESEDNIKFIYNSMVHHMREDALFRSLIENKNQAEISVVIDGKIYLVDNQMSVFEIKDNYSIVGFASEYFRTNFDILREVAGIQIHDDNFKVIFEKIISILGSVSSLVSPPYVWNILKNEDIKKGLENGKDF